MSTSTIIVEEIKQTCLFVQDGDSIKNLVRVKIFNQSESIPADLLLYLENESHKISLGILLKGENTREIFIPDIKESKKANFKVCDFQGNVLAETSVIFKPKKHWIVFLVQFSHHDLGYTDLPQNVLNEYITFYDLIAQYCEETENWPDDAKFRYQIEQLWSLFHYMRTQPKDKTEKILNLIKGGRLGVSALFGNMVSGLMGHEEIIRLLYPAFQLKRDYNISISVAELNDVPGISWGLATALSNAGINIIAPLLPRWYYGQYVSFWDESKVTAGKEPAVFLWESIDGKRILFWYQSMGFARDVGFDKGYDEVFKKLPDFLDKIEENGYPFDIILIRLVGGARDNSPPSLKHCSIARDWNNRWAYPRIVISTLDQFFNNLKRDYQHILDKAPVFRGEIPDSDYPAGATSTIQATIVNRNAHELIPTAEKFATIADWLFSFPYPWRLYIEKAYEHSILYDEHTWGLCCPFGPAQEASRIEKTLNAYKAYSLAHDVLIKGLNRIVDEINLQSKGIYVVVFNPISWKRTDIVRAQLMEPDPCGHPMFEAKINPESQASILCSSPVIGREPYYPPAEFFRKPFKIIDIESGREVFYNLISVTGSKTPIQFAADKFGVGQYESRFAQEILFVAKDVPPLGYKVYKIEEAEEQKSLRDADICEKPAEYIIENEFYRVEIDPERGIVKSLYDKEIKRELLDKDAPHKFGQIIVRETTTYKEYYVENTIVRRGLNGPVAKSIIIEGSALGLSFVAEEIILYDGIKRVDLNIRALKDSTPLLEVYVAFPFHMNEPSFTYEGPNIIVSPLKDQLPGTFTCYYPTQHWVNIFDKSDDFGVTLSSTDAYLMMFGGLWPLGVSFAHHGVTPPGYPSRDLRVNKFEKGYVYSLISTNNFRTNFYITQMGDFVLRFSLTSHRGNWKNMTSIQHGWCSTNPLIPVFAQGGKIGRLPTGAVSFCEITPPNVLILTLKCSEKDEDLIIRLWETLGEEVETKIKIPLLTIEKAYLTNIVEEEIKEIQVIDENTMVLTLKPFEVATIKIKGKKPTGL
ncbi:MAG: glycoside hydrolase family 38 C-terminal domain-containing protein [Candidatus Bathyarchaeia archaeon]